MITAFTGLLLLSQIVFWTGLALAFMLFFRFGKVKDWFNRKAGAEIVSTVRFRDVRTLCITIVLEWVMAMVGVLVTMSFYSEKQLTDNQFVLLYSLFLLVGLTYPAYRLVRRIRHLKSCNDRRAARWRLYYDCLLNYAALSGGWMVAVIMSFVAVLLSLTKWKSLVPGRLRDMSGVDVVPPSITYYLVGCVLGVVGIVSQFFGREKEDFIFGMIFVSLFAFLAYIVFRDTSGCSSGPEASEVDVCLYAVYHVCGFYPYLDADCGGADLVGAVSDFHVGIQRIWRVR